MWNEADADASKGKFTRTSSDRDWPGHSSEGYENGVKK